MGLPNLPSNTPAPGNSTPGNISEEATPQGRYADVSSSRHIPPPSAAHRPLPHKSKNLRWIIGGGAFSLLALCCVGASVVAVLLSRGLYVAARETPGARDATTDYFSAIAAHDWARAHSYLSASLRSTTSPAELQAMWTQREAANGKIIDFRIDNISVMSTTSGETAVVTGMLSYGNGFADPKIVRLIKEDGDWKFSMLP